MVKNYRCVNKIHQYRSTKRLFIIASVIIPLGAVIQGWNYVLSSAGIISLIGITICIFLSYLTDKYTPFYLRIVDNETLEHTDTSRFFFGIKRSYPIQSITKMAYHKFLDADSIRTTYTLENGKITEDCIWAVNSYEMSVIKEFLQDIARLNPGIQLDKTIQDWRDNPEAKFPQVLV